MTEEQYIIATNRAKVSLALHIMRDVMDGEKYGVDCAEYAEVRVILSQLEKDLFAKVKIETEGA